MSTNGSNMLSLKPRLVHLVKEAGVVSFGFNVTAATTDPYRYVGVVMENSLAEEAGLKSGDRVIEVNSVNIDGETLEKVQKRVSREGTAMEVQLLVADPRTDQLYRANHKIICSGLPETIYIRVPKHDSLPPPAQNVITNTVVTNGQMDAEVVDADAFINRDSVKDVHYNTVDLGQETGVISNGVTTTTTTTVITSQTGSSPIKARKCHIIKWNDNQGYGFVLHGDKDHGGQNIGKVDPGSPAEAAGLKTGDKVIEVNGVNVENEFQQAVVGEISKVRGETTLLVVDEDALRFFKGHDITIHGSMTDVVELENPRMPMDTNGNYQVRCCTVEQRPDFQGFGFILHGEKGVPGTIISTVDAGSPAEAAGLREGDRIIEVNGNNVEREEQPESIRLIKQSPNRTQLLVVDTNTLNYHRARNMPISSAMPGVLFLNNPPVEQFPDPEPQLPEPLPEEVPEPYPEPLPEPVHEPIPEPVVAPTYECRARICHIVKRDDFDGYGFYLHTEEGVSGTFIGKIDEDSPADRGKLKQGDRIIEVNGDNIETGSQDELVDKVRAVQGETRLLVVDDQAYRYFLHQGILINGDMTDCDICESQ